MPPSAPIDAQYLTLAANGVLTDYRILDVGSMLVAVDGGATGTYQLNVDPTQIDHDDLDNLTAGNPHTQYLQGTLFAANGDILTRVAGSPAALSIGSAGQVLTVAGGLPGWATPSPGDYASQFPPQISGRYQTPPVTTAALNTLTIVANRLYLVPFSVGRTTTFDRIAIEVTTLSAGNARLGIYGPFTGSFASIPLVTDAGTVSTGTTGVKTITINQALTPGWYFLAAVYDATPIVRAFTGTSNLSMVGAANLSGSNIDTVCYYAFTYGALPSPSTTAPTFNAQNIMFISLRAA